MSANRASFPVALMARVLGVSTAGYYAWLKRPASKRATVDATLLQRIRIARLMRRPGLAGACHRGSGPVTTRRDKERRPAPDLVDRNFEASAADQLWVADITFVPTASGFLYLAVVLDAWSRKIVGWSMASHLRTELVLDALEMAIGQRRPRKVIHHSDRDRNTPLLPSATAAAKLGCGPRWDRSATPMTTPWPRASSPHSNARCCRGGASSRRPKPAWHASASSRASTTRSACIPPWVTNRRSTTRRHRPKNSKRLRNQPSPETVHENG
jgi:transposase InsO family protein